MIKTITRLDSKIFQDVPRRQAVSNVIGKNAKEFKNLTKRRMIEGRPSGRIYDRKKNRTGTGFVRRHRASARGQRPAVETMTLVNAVTDKRTGETSSEVFIAPKVNPESKVTADRYAEFLQQKMSRPIMSKRDTAEAQAKLNSDGERAIETLV